MSRGAGTGTGRIAALGARMTAGQARRPCFLPENDGSRAPLRGDLRASFGKPERLDRKREAFYDVGMGR